MTIQQSADQEYVLICGVSWEAYQRVLEAVGDFHLRHAYDRGTLEMRRLLHGVPAESYRALLEALPEHHVRHTYDGWTLEMMTPRKDHEWLTRLIGRMIEGMALVLDIPIQSTGSTTLSAGHGERGLQPDASYYIAREPLVRGGETYRPGEDAPPDLVIEVDVTNSSVPRLPLYAQIGVRELWRYEDEEILFYRLTETAQYQPIDSSEAFAFVRPGDVTRFLALRHELDENAVIRAFIDWAREAQRRHQGPAASDPRQA